MASSLVGFVLAACAGTALAATLAQHTSDVEVATTSATRLVRTEKKASAAALKYDGSEQSWLATPQLDCPLPSNAKWCNVALENPFTMAVYNNDDIVSNSICNTGTWELQHEDIAALGKPGRAVDIGANIGFYSFVLAAAGWDVTSFEPMVANHALIEATLCKNPSFKSKITLNKVGLGAKADHCILVSGDDNLGDGIMKCGADAEKFQRDGQPSSYHQRSSMDIRRLDDILEEQKVKSIDFVKMDVEGFECNVMAGGQSLLTKFRPRMIQTEVWPHMQGCLPHDYLTSFAAASYTVAQDRVCSHPDDLSNPTGIVNRYMCRKKGGASLLQTGQGLEQSERRIVWLRRN